MGSDSIEVDGVGFEHLELIWSGPVKADSPNDSRSLGIAFVDQRVEPRSADKISTIHRPTAYPEEVWGCL